jgi:hypothetical protein
MAISKNITMGAIGAGRKAASEDKGEAPLKPPARSGIGGIGGIGAFGGPLAAATSFVGAAPPVAAQPPAGRPFTEASPGAAAVGPPAMTFVNATAIPGIRDVVAVPPRVFEIPPLVFQPFEKTTTQIAQGALNQLRSAAPGVIREAVNTIKNKNISAGGLLNQLERRTRVGEVLNELANDWSAETKQDFAEAFQMPNNADKLPVMDAIVSIAILNDPDLKNELLAENMSEASQGDLLENRRIVWQWPQPGTPFTPPYLIMVAVEHQDTSQAQKIIDSIIGDLVDFDGFKIPGAAAKKLR